ncbi:hypothetical protein F4775DRAFT_580998 [Biscogniauxia sp. FL1348]|nr:hypothetical protein F4775DRAFT_580998 [Biscogniauxia sp. FL1348]
MHLPPYVNRSLGIQRPRFEPVIRPWTSVGIVGEKKLTKDGYLWSSPRACAETMLSGPDLYAMNRVDVKVFRLLLNKLAALGHTTGKLFH